MKTSFADTAHVSGGQLGCTKSPSLRVIRVFRGPKCSFQIQRAISRIPSRRVRTEGVILWKESQVPHSRGRFVRMSCFHGMLVALASALAAFGRSDAGVGQDEGFRGVRAQAGRDGVHGQLPMK